MEIKSKTFDTYVLLNMKVLFDQYSKKSSNTMYARSYPTSIPRVDTPTSIPILATICMLNLKKQKHNSMEKIIINVIKFNVSL